MHFNIQTFEILLLVVALVSFIARRLHIPYSVGLLIAGVCLTGFTHVYNIHLGVHLTKELVFNIALPPLIFEAAFHIQWKELKQDLPVILTLATLGVLLATAVTTFGMIYFTGWSWIAALFFGVMIAATDPVSVIATFKDAGLTGRLKLLVESESLFNDGTAAVLFAVVLSIFNGANITPLTVTTSFLTMCFGGIACGALVAFLLLKLTNKTEDHLLETLFTTIVAYGSFILAEHFHVSGVLSTLVAGLIVGNSTVFTEKGREVVIAFWDFIAFLVNSFIFLLMGIQVAHQDFSSIWSVILIAIFVVLVGRVLAIYPLSLLFSRSPAKLSMPFQHVLFWGGLRGALALALALGLPDALPEKQLITTVVFAVVAFSIVLQGLTISPLLRLYKLIAA